MASQTGSDDAQPAGAAPDGALVDLQPNGHEEIPVPEGSLAASDGGQQTHPPQPTGPATSSLQGPSPAPPPPPGTVAFEDRILSSLMGRLDQMGIIPSSTPVASPTTEEVPWVDPGNAWWRESAGTPSDAQTTWQDPQCTTIPANYH